MSPRLDFFGQKFQQMKGRYDQIKKEYRKDEKRLEEEETNQKHLEEALLITQTVAKKTQEELEYRISEIVTMALGSVFDDPYEFCIRFDIKRGKTEATMFFSREGEEIDPLNASGGGVVDVAALALRLSCYLITRPRPAPIFFFE